MDSPPVPQQSLSLVLKSAIKSEFNNIEKVIQDKLDGRFCRGKYFISKNFHQIWRPIYRAFVSTRPLVHKHVKMSVGKWIFETTRPHKHVQIPKDIF